VEEESESELSSYLLLLFARIVKDGIMVSDPSFQIIFHSQVKYEIVLPSDLAMILYAPSSWDLLTEKHSLFSVSQSVISFLFVNNSP
jgi:hypothetical protein